MAMHSTGENCSCPINLSPPSVVVRYGHPVAINCSTLTNESLGMGWEAAQRGTGLEMVNHLTWAVERLVDWNISLFCYMYIPCNRQRIQCLSRPTVVLYSEFHT